MNIPFSKFQELYPQQKEALEFIARSEAPVIGISAPTGSGKSLLGMMASEVLKTHKQVYLCSSRHLQDQLHRDFPEAVVLKGRRNYPCLRFGAFDLTAEECVKEGCEYVDQCPYEEAKRRAKAARWKVMNFAYWLLEANYVGVFSNQDLVIIDEADLLEGALTDFVSLSISRRRMAKLGLKMPKFKTKWEAFLDWARGAKGVVEEKAKALKVEGQEDPEVMREYVNYKRLVQKLDLLIKCLSPSWLMEDTGYRIAFKPLWLDRELVDRFLLRHSQRFLLMSATLPPKPILCSLLGLKQEEVDYLELPSSFDISNRQVIYRPVANLNKENLDGQLGKLIGTIKDILDRHKDQRVLIHSVSYSLGTKLYESLSSSSRPVFFHRTSEGKRQAMERYMSHPDAVIISPSLERGVNLKDEACRAIVWVKCPFPSLGDKFTSLRFYSSRFGRLWYKYQAAYTLVQGAGRGVRHKEDWATTYILDGQFERLLRDRVGLFPRWFREAVVWE